MAATLVVASLAGCTTSPAEGGSGTDRAARSSDAPARQPSPGTPGAGASGGAPESGSDRHEQGTRGHATSEGDSAAPGGKGAPQAQGDGSPTAAGNSSAKVVPTDTFRPSKPAGKTYVWEDNAEVSHLFFHSLIVNPRVAFNDPQSGNGYLDYMITIDEFRRILDQVYQKGYVLVSPHQLARVTASGAVKPRKLRVPRGKKPLVLSVDDVSYYQYMKGDGFASKLIVGPDGGVENEYTDPITKAKSTGAYDVMPIVDEFVAKHPDFAPYGYKGVIALTGYNGVLGYRSSPSVYKKGRRLNAAIDNATRVANALKSEGWQFASHSWGHINFTTSSLTRIKTDTQRWKDDVEPIIGPTDLLIYPFGADIAGIEHYSGAKYDYLKAQGFNFYFNVDGSTTHWGQFGKGYLREARINVDGISLHAAVNGRKVLGAFFDAAKVIDPLRPKAIEGKK
ncbi:polysaccharide deacetylase family protein [Rarobacter incanus]|uniref:polysaccharide deacetylase family protein n=1 Tax=Rarobacter incanus TaxID=153494 RepID=UPI001FE56B04|nr:polysaccharide deacetylase family protein [Rarobacter incanus]